MHSELLVGKLRDEKMVEEQLSDYGKSEAHKENLEEKIKEDSTTIFGTNNVTHISQCPSNGR